MIIDAHVHVFPEAIAGRALSNLSQICGSPYFSDGTVAGTRKKFQEWGIDGAVCLNIATKPKQQTTINNCAASIQGDGLYCFGSVHPDAPDVLDELQRIKDLGLYGVKFHPDYQGFLIDDEKMFPIYDAVSSLHLPAVFHTGWDPFSPKLVHAPSRKVAKVAKLFPKMILIAAHMGGMCRYDEVEEYLLPQENIYLDTAMSSQYCNPEQFERIIRKHGAEHILFGSDCPWSKSCDEVNYLERAHLSSRDLDLIFSGNIMRLLQI